MIRADQRHEYGEERLQMLGQVQGRVFHVVFTMRGFAIRIISARKGNLREVNDYENGAFQTRYCRPTDAGRARERAQA